MIVFGKMPYPPSLFQKGVHLSEPGADSRPCHHLAKESERDDFCFWKVTSYSPRSRSRVRTCLTCIFEVCIWTTNIYRDWYSSRQQQQKLQITSASSFSWANLLSISSMAKSFLSTACCSSLFSLDKSSSSPSWTEYCASFSSRRTFWKFCRLRRVLCRNSSDDYLTLFVARLSCSWRSWSFADCSTFSSACLSSLASRLSIYRREMLYFSGLLMLKF